MTKVQPRRIVHRGWVEASGFLFDTQLIGMREARRRILELWVPGVQVHRNGMTYFVRLLAPLRVNCARSPGTPLVMTGDIISALPLTPNELSSLAASTNTVVYALGGGALLLQSHASSLESPTEWIDVASFKTLSVKSLGLIQEPRVVTEPQPFDARKKLDGAPPAAPELLETIAALKGGKGKGQNENAGGEAAGVEIKRIVSGLIAMLVGSTVNLLDKFSGANKAPAHRGTGQRGKGNGSDSSLDTPFSQFGAALSGRLRRLAVRLLQTSRLAGIFGRRQAEYMARMMDMFERGDLDEALRHAVPLGDVSDGIQAAPALGVPKPRNSLTIVPQRRRSNTAIGAGDELLNYLRQLYRTSFERLLAQGRLEEAAFVLAELLRANEEAVAFLERHGKLKLAAELAEARGLPPGLIVRQWFLAGEVERAVGIARRFQVFGDAVIRLEKTNKEQGDKLRVLWAESLAEAGNYAAAVDVIWPLKPQRVRAREWMDQTIALGGPLAARMLARKLSLVPEEFADVRSRALSFLEDESYEHRDARLQFAEALCHGERTPGAQTLARATARAILRDAGQDSHPMQPKQFRSVLDFSGDGALRTDVPPWPDIEPEVTETLCVEFSSLDRSSIAIAEAALLGDGRLLVALGEAGVRLLTRDGRSIAHFDQPAHRLVLSEHGDRAIVLARRGEAWRLARIDLLARRADDWCEAQINVFAPDYDGTLWFIGAKGDFYAIDATAKNFDALWRVPETGERVVGVTRSASTCRFLTANAARLEKWVYTLPLLMLRNRTTVPILHGNVSCVDLRATFSADGTFVDQSLYATMEHEFAMPVPCPVLHLRLFDSDVVKHEFVIGDGHSRPGQPEVLGNVAVSPVYEADGARVRVIDLRMQRIRAEFFLSEATHVSTRLTANTFTFADDCGRLLVLDLNRNCLIRNLRV